MNVQCDELAKEETTKLDRTTKLTTNHFPVGGIIALNTKDGYIIEKIDQIMPYIRS